MATPYITIGCPTTGGGVVQEGDSSFQIEGIPIACVGHKATCPLHKTVSTIISGDQYFKVGGKPAARAGDSLSCGCKLLPKQSLVVGDNGGGFSMGGANNTSGGLKITDNKLFDEQVITQFDFAEGMPYLIELESGKTFKGTVGSDGKLPRINTENEGTYTLYLGEDAISKGSEGGS